MKNPSFTFVEGKRKYLLYTDHTGAESVEPLIRTLLHRRLPFEWHVAEGMKEADMTYWLSSQTIGTYLYLAGKRELVETGRTAAYEAGYSDDEFQTLLVGEPMTRIFCTVCEQLSLVPKKAQVICAQCKAPLSVTDHFSPRLQAYLAYRPISLETKVITE
jgi:hypothetical protein